MTCRMSGLVKELKEKAEALRMAPSGIQIGGGFEARDWLDKPHRLLYDAAYLLEKAAKELEKK